MNSIDIKTTAKAAKKFSKSPAMPILETVLISKGDLYFTDLETTLVVRNIIQNKNIEGSAPINRFFEVMNILKDEKFSMRADQDYLLFETTEDLIKLPLTDSAEYPETRAGTDFLVCGNPTQNDLLAIQKASNFLSTEEMRPAMQNVYINHHICGTDGHRMFFDKTQAAILEPEILINTKVIELLKILNPSSVWMGRHYLNRRLNKIKFDNVEIYWQQTTSKFPDFLSVIPAQKAGYVEFSKENILKSMKKIVLGLNPSTKKMQITPNCTKTVFEAANIDADITVNSTVTSKNVGDLEPFAVNYTYWESILKQIDCDTITLDFETPNKALILNKNYLLMPVRLQ